MYSTSNSALSQRRSRNWRNCSTLPSIAWRLTLLRDTPAVAAISGSTSAYSRVETPRNSAPIMRCAVASFSCRDSYAGTLTSPPSLWRRRGRFTLICRSARLTRPFCDPCQRISPLLLPGVRGPATCSALKLKMVSMVWRPMRSITSSTAMRACVTSSTSGSKICPFALANSSTFATAAAASRSTIWYVLFTAVVVLSRIVFGEPILTNRTATAALNLQLTLGHAPNMTSTYMKNANGEGKTENAPRTEIKRPAIVQAGGRPIAIALEQSRGSLLFMLLKYEHRVLFPVHPSTLVNYRKGFRPSGAKNDPSDATLLVDLLVRHRERLRRLHPDSEQTRTLQFLVEGRRKFVHEKVRYSNRLTA